MRRWRKLNVSASSFQKWLEPRLKAIIIHFLDFKVGSTSCSPLPWRVGSRTHPRCDEALKVDTCVRKRLTRYAGNGLRCPARELPVISWVCQIDRDERPEFDEAMRLYTHGCGFDWTWRARGWNADDIVKEPENFSVPWKSAYITRVPPLSASVCDDIDFAESHVIPTELWFHIYCELMRTLKRRSVPGKITIPLHMYIRRKKL